ncbi:hypothetical protein [Falsiroseomonas sp. CW058]|uniref:hypothetical protein n=1 Tax=Falsiroseomonas sp. CW058 TaxID=3388664 RepID=UPI003D319EAD
MTEVFFFRTDEEEFAAGEFLLLSTPEKDWVLRQCARAGERWLRRRSGLLAWPRQLPIFVDPRGIEVFREERDSCVMLYSVTPAMDGEPVVTVLYLGGELLTTGQLARMAAERVQACFFGRVR